MKTKYFSGGTGGLVKNGPGCLRGAVVVFGTAEADLSLFDGTDSSTDPIMVVTAVTGQRTASVVLPGEGLPFSNLFCELAGAGGEANVYYD